MEFHAIVERTSDNDFLQAVFFALTADHGNAFSELMASLTNRPRFAPCTVFSGGHEQRSVMPLSAQALVPTALRRTPLPLSCIKIMMEMGAEVRIHLYLA